MSSESGGNYLWTLKHYAHCFYLKHQHCQHSTSYAVWLKISRIGERSRAAASLSHRRSFEMLWKAALKHRMQTGLKNCPGLGLLIVSSVLAKSAGCDSRPLSVTRWPLGLASSPLTCPITASTVSLSSPRSHLKVFAGKNEDQRLGVKEERCRLTISDCGLTSLGSGVLTSVCWVLIILPVWQSDKASL